MFQSIKNLTSQFPRARAFLTVAAVAAALFAIVQLAGSSGGSGGRTTFTTRQGPLLISVLEGGSVSATESLQLRCEVEGREGAKILSIVEEGTLLTDEDVTAGKILVELDSAGIREEIIDQDIDLQTAVSSLAQAEQSLEIQISQNESSIKSAEQKARFSLMDFEKYMGEKATRDVLNILGLPVSDFRPEKIQGLDLSAIAEIRIEFSKYADAELLGDGEAKQKLRQLQDEHLVAQSELGRDEENLAGTQRLYDSKFVTRNTLENDKITVQKSQLRVKTAGTALDLFIKYEFPKAAEESLSAYQEALRELQRTNIEASAKLAQEEVKLQTAKKRFEIETTQKEDLDKQLAACVIRATQPGLVTYGGGSGGGRGWRDEEEIREGATVYQRQTIITIPNMEGMAVSVKIHESDIKKITKGLRAKIRVDAYPNKNLSGFVSKVAVLPDSRDRWLNPDLKVYVTTITIDGTHEWLKPGMSARAEIIIDRLDNVVYVPLQAVIPHRDGHICFVNKGGRPEMRKVSAGQFNDEFIIVQNGLDAGEEVLLQIPEEFAAELVEQRNEETPEEESANASAEPVQG